MRVLLGEVVSCILHDVLDHFCQLSDVFAVDGCHFHLVRCVVYVFSMAQGETEVNPLVSVNQLEKTDLTLWYNLLS